MQNKENCRLNKHDRFNWRRLVWEMRAVKELIEEEIGKALIYLEACFLKDLHCSFTYCWLLLLNFAAMFVGNVCIRIAVR